MSITDTTEKKRKCSNALIIHSAMETWKYAFKFYTPLDLEPVAQLNE